MHTSERERGKREEGEATNKLGDAAKEEVNDQEEVLNPEPRRAIIVVATWTKNGGGGDSGQ